MPTGGVGWPSWRRCRHDPWTNWLRFGIETAIIVTIFVIYEITTFNSFTCGYKLQLRLREFFVPTWCLRARDADTAKRPRKVLENRRSST